MVRQNNIEEDNSNINHFSTNDHYSIFLKLCESEIKFIVPWVQYDEKASNKRKFDSPQLEIEEKALFDVLSLHKTEI